MQITYQITSGKNGHVTFDSRQDRIRVFYWDDKKASVMVEGYLSIDQAKQLRDDLDEVIREVES